MSLTNRQRVAILCQQQEEERRHRFDEEQPYIRLTESENEFAENYCCIITIGIVIVIYFAYHIIKNNVPDMDIARRTYGRLPQTNYCFVQDLVTNCKTMEQVYLFGNKLTKRCAVYLMMKDTSFKDSAIFCP